MKTLLTIGLFIGCVLGMAPGLYAQEIDPPHAVLPGPVRMPPDFQAGPRQPQPRRRTFDSARAQKRAQELAKLADQVPDEVTQVSHDVLPKDLIHNLKRIEKLARQLRKQVSR